MPRLGSRLYLCGIGHGHIALLHKGLVPPADFKVQVKVGVEVVCLRIRVVEVVGLNEGADVLEKRLGGRGKQKVAVNMIMIDLLVSLLHGMFRVIIGIFLLAALYFQLDFRVFKIAPGRERRLHQSDKKTVVVLARDAEPALRPVLLDVSAKDDGEIGHAQIVAVPFACPALFPVEAGPELRGAFVAVIGRPACVPARMEGIIFGIDGLHGRQIAAPVGVVLHGECPILGLQVLERLDREKVAHTASLPVHGINRPSRASIQLAGAALFQPHQRLALASLPRRRLPLGGGASGYSGPWAVFAALLPVGKDRLSQS